MCVMASVTKVLKLLPGQLILTNNGHLPTGVKSSGTVVICFLL